MATGGPPGDEPPKDIPPRLPRKMGRPPIRPRTQAEMRRVISLLLLQVGRLEGGLQGPFHPEGALAPRAPANTGVVSVQNTHFHIHISNLSGRAGALGFLNHLVSLVTALSHAQQGPESRSVIESILAVLEELQEELA